ncbi:MAG: endonuclease III [Chlamydiota bacterium]
MNRAHLIQQVLEKYIPDPQPALLHTSHFTLLVSVLLSAQCTDKAVNRITPSLFALADTPEKMSVQTQETIFDKIRSLGLAPKKSKAILSLSKILVEEFGGDVPPSLEALMRLPGVGRKTALVVLSQGFGIPSFPVDTHIHRCSHRWGLSTGKTPLHVEKDLCRLFPKSSWNRLHLQIILFARRYCPAKKHTPAECPICSLLPHEEE